MQLEAEVDTVVTALDSDRNIEICVTGENRILLKINKLKIFETLANRHLIAGAVSQKLNELAEQYLRNMAEKEKTAGGKRGQDL